MTNSIFFKLNFINIKNELSVFKLTKPNCLDFHELVFINEVAYILSFLISELNFFKCQVKIDFKIKNQPFTAKID